MKPLVATYRLQFNPGFTFTDASSVLGYIRKLGISHIYSSPVFRCRKGSFHGYDVTDHNGINPELGTKAEYSRLLDLASSLSLGWIQGIVPNHMAYSMENLWLMNLFEEGRDSRYWDVFDIEWEHHSEALKQRVLAPFLESDLEEALSKRVVRLCFDDGFKIAFWQQFPVSLESYSSILSSKKRCLAKIADEDPCIKRLIGLCQMEGKSSLRELKALCSLLYASSQPFKACIDGILDLYNSDSNLLRSLILSQNYLLAHWRDAFKEINYRRFFNINDLICIRMEDEAVFRMTHGLALELVKRGKVDGLRIDHIDGLMDPLEYLRRLRHGRKRAHILVEKILLGKEELPEKWPVEGTTGYEVLNKINGVFVDCQNEAEFERSYRDFTGCYASSLEVLEECKRVVLSRLFKGDVDSLTHAFMSAVPASLQMQKDRMRMAVVAILSSFPVYRSYLSPEARAEDGAVVIGALERAMQKHPRLAMELGVIKGLLKTAGESRPAINCFMRLQQYTGPVMAKGLEDTAFYRYNRLLSMNEVGNAFSFGAPLEEFHQFNVRRAAKWPRAMSATSTHDTKRGEDARARLNVLSEMPKEWGSRLARWHDMNRPRKRFESGSEAPTKNEEYYIYQALIASLPHSHCELTDFRERFRDHILKAIREAKENSSWLSPSPSHESAVLSFVDAILDPSEGSGFLKDFIEFQSRIAHYGVYNSLSQTLLKAACPGVPDYYQGSEFWDFSMADPDNRRRVDFSKRMDALEILEGANEIHFERLLESAQDSLVKLLVMIRTLQARGDRPRLFTEGRYIPLEIEGEFGNHIVAFARVLREEWAVATVPRFLTYVISDDRKPLGESAWGDTKVVIPRRAPSAWRNVITEEVIMASENGGRKIIDLGTLFKKMPIALISSWDSPQHL